MVLNITGYLIKSLLHSLLCIYAFAKGAIFAGIIFLLLGMVDYIDHLFLIYDDSDNDNDI